MGLIIKFIDVRKDERKLFRLLFFYAFLIGLSTSFFFVQASRNFILKVSIAEMPTAYIVSGLLGYMLIQVYKKLQRKLGVIKSFIGLLSLFTLLMIGLYVLDKLFIADPFSAKVLAYSGSVCMFAFATLLAVGFAGICLSIFNLSQSKRLLALLGIGEIMASILGYLTIPLLIKLMGGSSYLLILAAVFSLFSIWPVYRVLLDKKVTHPAPSKTQETPVPAAFNMDLIWKNPYILYLALTTLFSIIAVYFIDYSYLISVRYFSEITGIEIASVVAMVFTVIKVGELVASLFSANIVSSSGMKMAVLMLPWLLIGGSVMAILSVIVFNGSPVFMIVFIFVNKWSDRVIRKGITIPSMKVMFQVNSPEERVQLQNNIDGVISQLSTIVSGALLIGICFFTGTGDYNKFLTVTTVVCLVMFILFLLVSTRLFRIYKVTIQDFLRSKNVLPASDNAPAEALLSRQQSREELISEISSNNRFAGLIHVYAENDIEAETKFTRKLSKLYFDHNEPAIRQSIVSYVARLGFPALLSFFKDSYGISPLNLRTQLLKGLCASDQIIEESEVFYFAELTQECIQEIVWADAALGDLSEADTEQLIVRLNIHRNSMIELLLYFLQILHDKQSVKVVGDIVTKKDCSEEDALFAGELLENILRPEIKKMILPVFEPISFNSRRNKLRTFFFIDQLTVKQRLLDILMHDYNLTDQQTKQLALAALNKLDPDPAVTRAFSESNINDLKIFAREQMVRV